MTPRLSKPPRTLEQAIADSIAERGNPLVRMAMADAKLYRRERDLPRVLSVTQDELTDYSMAGTQRIVERLAAAFSVERGVSEINRQLALAGPLIAERERLESLKQKLRDENFGCLVKTLEQIL
jgi:hypothetical protein